MDLLDEIQAKLESLDDVTETSAGEDSSLSLAKSRLTELRKAMDSQNRELVDINARSDALRAAQADAIVRSAEIIHELEETKQRLSESKQQAVLAARETQHLADIVFERTNDGILVLQGSVCVACNQNATRLLQTKECDLLGRQPEALQYFQWEAESSELSIESILATATESPQTHQAEFVCDTGGFWAELTISTFRMKEVDHVLMVIRNITDRKNFESELRRHRDFLDNIINSVPDQLSVKASDGTLVVANDAFCESQDKDRDKLIGRRLDELKATSQEAASQVDGLSEVVDACNLRGDQVYSVRRSVFRDGSGDRYVVSTSRDVTQDRQREQKLRLLASVFDSASEGVAILSPYGEIIEANPAFAGMSGATQEELVGRPFAETLQFDMDELASTLRCVSGGAAWSGKARGLAHRGNTRSYWVSLSPSTESKQTLTPVIALVSDISELESTQAKLRQQAYFDNLTGLPNRRYFREHLTRLLVKSSSPHSICFVDLDDFKCVNDSAGHSVGDRLLQAVAKRIRHVVGHDVLVSRFGGDEFAIISEGTPSANELMLERLLKAFREPFGLRQTEALIGLSIGVTRYPEDGNDVDTLMSNADIAMYAAKSSGKNQIRVFASEMQQAVNVRAEVQMRLRHALSSGELSLWFQPKVCARKRTPVGCEALIRWRTKDGRYVSPGDFIPVAEQTGLILPLGDLVFELAAEQACLWQGAGLMPNIAVNVSPRQIRHPRFLERLLRTVENAGASPSWFELEITEYAVMDDVEHASEIIDELKRLGFRVAIDDFGTGYSSLSYIKTFALDTLKIDMSFVRDVAEDRSSQAVIQSIVSLGLGLNMSVVAEGVETAQQADILETLGCTTLQGYHLGRPMPADEYTSWLREVCGVSE